jgi:hypothetical protein
VNKSQIFPAVLCLGIGVYSLWSALFNTDSPTFVQRLPVILFGLAWLAGAAKLLDVERLLKLDTTWTVDWSAVGFGALMIGLSIFLFSLMQAEPDSMTEGTPMWVALGSAAVFFLGGLLLIQSGIRRIGGDSEKNLIGGLLIALLTSSMAAVAVWIAFGEGTRGFSVGVVGLKIALPEGFGDVVGRLCFGAGAILMSLIALVMWHRLIGLFTQRLNPGPDDGVSTD